MSDQPKTFLHIGCGTKRKDQTTRGFDTADWREIRLDIDPAANPDIVGSVLDMGEVPDASVDAVYSSHNIEHLYPHEVGRALAEIRRVLGPEAFLVVTCPDLQGVCALIARDKLLEPAYVAPDGPVAPLDILYGYRPYLAAGNLFMAHHCGFTRRSLAGTLQANGFASVATIRRPAPSFDLWAVATKTAVEETRLRALAAAHFPPG